MSAGSQPALPQGWRWESYGGVQVGVPGDWGWGNSSQRLSQWCAAPERVAGERAALKPIVGRPGPATLVGCPGADRSPAPDTLVENTGLVVGFGHTGGRPDGVEHEGDRTTVRRNGVAVVVQAPAELRQRIVATVHPVDVDVYGCPATHPISAAPGRRPAKPVDVSALTEVSAISACRYPHRMAGEGSALPLQSSLGLQSSLRLERAPAARAIQEIANAPRGGGPDNPEQCLASASYGDDSIVLSVRSSVGVTEIVLRYSGCDHNGFDDGIVVRSLTAAAVKPFIAGPNGVYSFSGPPEKTPMLQPGTTTD